jgi:2-aminoadipate transaminase
MPVSWTSRYAKRTAGITSSVIRELLKLVRKPGMISFAGGLPAPEVFPVARIRESCLRVLDHAGPEALQYSPTEGYLPLREQIAAGLASQGVPLRAENILITCGSQQALDLLGKLLIDSGDRIVVEAPTYLGALQAFDVFGAEYVAVPVDHDGLCLDQVEAALRSGPKFLYVMPNFQNPAGVTLALERRRQLVSLAEKFGVPIVEDDPYEKLRYEGESLPPLIALDPAYRGPGEAGGGNVIYLSTFSKTLAPGLRLGWIAGPAGVIAKLVQIKQGADLHTSTFSQMLAYEAATGGFLERHTRTICRVYRERRDAMLDALQAMLPPGAACTRPQGGLFLWATLPEGMDSRALLEHALAEGVAFVPGDCFYAGGSEIGRRQMRLNFSYVEPERIREGIRRLSAALRRYMDERGMTTAAK